MPSVFNAKNLTFENNKSPIPEFSWLRSPDLGEMVKSRNLRFDIKILEPGKYSYPYHFHRNAEELFVIISGNLMLRSPEGFSELSEGDIAYFEVGESSAHQLYNHTDKPCMYLDIRTDMGLDVCEYPDSGKINILPDREIYQVQDRVEYFKNEDRVSEKWPDEIKSAINKDNCG